MAAVQTMIDDPSVQLGLRCYGCGILRLIPRKLKVGESFVLATCPKCGVGAMQLKLSDEGFEEVVH